MTTTGVLLLAVLDSINPSAIVVTLYLLSTSKSRVLAQVGVYLGSIFVTYSALGAILLLGVDALLPSLGDALRGRIGFLLCKEARGKPRSGSPASWGAPCS